MIHSLPAAPVQPFAGEDRLSHNGGDLRPRSLSPRFSCPEALSSPDFDGAHRHLLVGITTGLGNPQVSARVCLGLGYGLDNCTPAKTRTPATGWQV
jgi:hypothetical protein